MLLVSVLSVIDQFWSMAPIGSCPSPPPCAANPLSPFGQLRGRATKWIYWVDLSVCYFLFVVVNIYILDCKVKFAILVNTIPASEQQLDSYCELVTVLKILSSHCCAEVQPHWGAGMAVDSAVVGCTAVGNYSVLCFTEQKELSIKESQTLLTRQYGCSQININQL